MDEQGICFFDVVPIKKEHIKQLSLLEKSCFSQPWSEDAFIEELTNPLAVFKVAVERQSKNVIGYVGMHHILDEGYITNIAVLEEYRQKGIAKKLMQIMFEYAKQNYMSFITLEVRVSNKIAVDFYKNFGFKILGIRKNFYISPTEDAYIMTAYKKSLLSFS